jgi:hypothetical protein
MALIWYFASAPSIRLLAEDEAMVTMAFSHAGDLREPCRDISSEELAKLPPNMRIPQECPRERSPVVIEMLLDGQPLYNESLQPPGLFNDGGVNIYFSRKIPAGIHHFEIKMDDSVREEGFNHILEQDININPAQILLIDFDSEKGFVVR